MNKKKLIPSVSIETVYNFIQRKTPCCQLENGQIKCSASFSHHRYCYDVFIKNHQQDFSIVFMDGEKIKTSAEILAEAGIFFADLISANNIIQNSNCVQVKVPAQFILSVIEKLNIYRPQNDETILLPEDFTDFSQDKKLINKKCLELDDDFDEDYNIVL